MIISASRRTDIPALYSQWFMNRLQEGYALIPNPRNPKRLGRVEFSPDKVDCIIFWTKNPAPMLDKLWEIEERGYSFYFQFTLTPYDQRLERNLPPKSELIRTFRELAERIGPEKVVWRYDPIIIDSTYTLKWHIEHFAEMCAKLNLYTKRIILSFVDPQISLDRKIRALTEDEIHILASRFSKIAAQYNLPLFTCAEEIDLTQYGIVHSSCIDQKLIEEIIGCPIKAKKDRNQRETCQCIESIDLGVYDTCINGCTYCYATSNLKRALGNFQNHDPMSPILTGYPKGDEIITERTTSSQKLSQLRFFD